MSKRREARDAVSNFRRVGIAKTSPVQESLGKSVVKSNIKYWKYVIRSSFWQAVATAALGWAALGSHLQTKIWHFAMAFAT